MCCNLLTEVFSAIHKHSDFFIEKLKQIFKHMEVNCKRTNRHRERESGRLAVGLLVWGESA